MILTGRDRAQRLSSRAETSPVTSSGRRATSAPIGVRRSGGNNLRLLKGFGSLTDDCIAMASKTKRYVTPAGLKTRLVLGLILLVVGLSLLQTWNNDRTTRFVDPLFVMAITACVGGVWDLLGALRAGIWIDPRGITVRGTLRTRRLVWDDIASFDMEASAGFGGKCLRVRLRNGEAIKVDAIQQPRFGPDYNTSIVQELNDALASATMPVHPDSP